MDVELVSILLLWVGANAVVLAPLLVSANVRRLFLGRPTGRLPTNFALAVACYTAMQAVVLLTAALAGSVVGDGNETAFGWLLFGVLFPPVGTGAAIGLAAPRVGWWDPDAVESATGGRTVVAAGVLWYLPASVLLGAFLYIALWAIPLPQPA